MKKSKKLISIFLAVLMIFSSISVAASAAKATYKTVADLESKKAYSPYGTVTRLDSETRMSIVLDFLDITLKQADINMGQLFNVAGLSLTVDLRSVNALLGTVDNVRSLRKNLLVRLVAGLLGMLKDLNVDTWETGMTREKTDQLKIVAELLELLSANTDLVNTAFTDGINLGVANSALPDLSGINNLLKNVPGAVTPFVLSMLSRPDDKAADRTAKSSTDPKNLVPQVQKFVEAAFSKPMSTTSYRVNASGANAGYTPDLPTTPSDTSRYFVFEDDKTITQYDYKYNGLMDSNGGVWEKTATYTLDKEEEFEGSGTYLYRDEWGNSLKWYKADGVADLNGNIQSQYLLPSVAEAVNSGKLTFEINGADSLGSLLYKFIPYIFAEMAPTVLNGSAKKLIAEAFDVTFTKIGKKGDAGLPSDEFFAKEQEYYVWEYTDYKVIDGVPYYRYQDDFFVGEIPSNISAFYYMFNWDWEITDDFVNEFIPSSVGSGYLVDNLNNLVAKAIKTMIAESWDVKGKTVTREEVFQWQEGGNELILDNILNTIRAGFMLAPEEIFDEYYMDAQFYDAMMYGTKEEAVKGLIMELVKMLMPQIKFSDNLVNEPMLAIGAVVVRELCTQLMPTYDFDAMIYSDYTGSKAVLSGKSSDYWLDTILYMGVNLGMYYLRNLADIGEDDTTLGYFAVMKNLGALPTDDDSKGITFKADAQYANGTPSWLIMVDWVADWALSTQAAWCWKFGNFIDVTGAVDLTSYQNPLDKISSVFTKLFPELNTLLNTDGLSDAYGSSSVLAKILKSGLVDSITSLDVNKLLGMLKLKSDSVLVSTKLVDSLLNKILKPLLNNIFYKLAGNKNLIPDAINSVDTLLNQNNIKAFVVNLVGALYTAYQKGLLDTVLPLVNFFVGWTTDPQKYADPILSLSSTDIVNAWNDHTSVPQTDYILANGNSGTSTLEIFNNCSGMLLKHRNSNTTDHAYDIIIDKIYSKTGDNVTTNAKLPITVAPGESADPITITIPYSADKMVDISVDYRYVGKDGNALGGTQTQSVYKLVSKVNYTNVESGEESAKGTGCSDPPQAKYWSYMKHNVVGDLSSVEAIYVRYENQVNKNTWVYSITPAANMSPVFGIDTSVVHGASENAALKEDFIGFMNASKQDSNTTWDALVYQLKDKEYEPTSGETFNLGYTISWANGNTSGDASNTATLTVGTTVYYYNVDDLEPLVHNPLYAEDYDTAKAGSAWTNYLAVLAEAAFLVDGPKNYDTFKTLYAESNIEAVQAKLEAAIEALDDYKAETTKGDVNKVVNMLASLETNPNRDINYQDYQLFEYFKYENERTAAREMIKSAIAPEDPKPYIENDNASYETIEATIGAVTGDNADKVQAGITATLVEPDWDYSDFVPATYTDVAIENQAAMLQYYYNFMKANPKDTISKIFLDREIKYAEGQAYDEAEYSIDSWARYSAALANAKAVNANGSASESEIFDAKYELMVAQNQLMEKYKSMKESGYLDYELNTVIMQANHIIKFFGAPYAVVQGVDETEAFAQLVSALGVAYNLTEDGGVDNVALNLANGNEDFTAILYSRSALTFQAYDRLNTIKNKKAVDDAAEKLRDAVANFIIPEDGNVTLLPKDESMVGKVDHGYAFIQGITPGSIDTVEELITYLESTGGTTMIGKENEDGMFGTGATVTVMKDGEAILKYFVVIYGDVNGDGAVDGFDTFNVNKHMTRLDTLLNVYETAGDADGDGIVTEFDYALIKQASAGNDVIDQVK